MKKTLIGLLILGICLFAGTSTSALWVEGVPGVFEFTEVDTAATAETGTVRFFATGDTVYIIDESANASALARLAADETVTGDWTVTGTLTISGLTVDASTISLSATTLTLTGTTTAIIANAISLTGDDWDDDEVVDDLTINSTSDFAVDSTNTDISGTTVTITGTSIYILPTTDDNVLYIGKSAVTQKSFWVIWTAETSMQTVELSPNVASIFFEDIDQYMNDNDSIFFGDGGAEGYIKSDGSDLIISGDTTKLYGETFTIMCKFGTVAASTDDERGVFVAPFDCTITAAYLLNATTVATSATAITTLTLNDKGSGGAGNNAIAAWNCGATGTVLTAFDAITMGALDGTLKLLTALDTVTIKKVDSGGVGAGTDELVLMLSYKRR